MGRIIARNIVDRKEGHLYYVDGEGNVCEAQMARGGRKKKTTATRQKKATTARRTTARRSSSRRTTARRS